jgi:hypothetical protein
MIEENNRRLSLHGLPENQDVDRSSLLASESRIGFVLLTFTMAAYGENAFYAFFKTYAKVKENEFVTSDIGSLSSILLNSEVLIIIKPLDYIILEIILHLYFLRHI